MTQIWRALEWDSDFFGVPIARIDLCGADRAAIARAELQAREAGITCLYGDLDPSAVETIDTVDVVQRLGYRLMEVALDLDHPTSVLVDPPPTRSFVRVGTIADVARLEEQIAVVAPWSRFFIDPRFGSCAARALHRAWVERAATGEDGRVLLVAEDAAGVSGMATLSTSSRSAAVKNRPRIDLIASTKNRSGAAQALVAHAFAGFGPGLSLGGPIAARNRVSLRFSEQMGYRVAGTRYLFHRWLDEEDARRSSVESAVVG